MEAGRIIKTGGKELALELEERGYDWVGAEHQAGRAAEDRAPPVAVAP
jgi:Fe-S cluster assembly ATP-binding protein